MRVVVGAFRLHFVWILVRFYLNSPPPLSSPPTDEMRKRCKGLKAKRLYTYESGTKTTAMDKVAAIFCVCFVGEQAAAARMFFKT